MHVYKRENIAPSPKRGRRDWIGVLKLRRRSGWKVDLEIQACNTGYGCRPAWMLDRRRMRGMRGRRAEADTRGLFVGRVNIPDGEIE